MGALEDMYRAYAKQQAQQQFESLQDQIRNKMKNAGQGGLQPSEPVPNRVQKAFDLYCGTDNEGERAAAKQAMERMGYTVRIKYQLIRKK